MTQLVTCQGRDHLVNIRSGRHNIVIVNVRCEFELTLRQLRDRLCLIHPYWPAYPCGVGVNLIQKDDFLFGTNHFPRATRERLQCFFLSFLASSRLPNLTT